MPNLIPPLTRVSDVQRYKADLEALAPDVTFLTTLYLHPSITPEVISAAAIAGIAGVKAYPAGVTTNSAAGVVDWKVFYPAFAAMQEKGLVLNLHGEVPGPSSSSVEGQNQDVTVLTAESLFLPTLHEIHSAFPNLRIVLEHCTTAAALDAVAKCGNTVAATITAHHLSLTTDDVVGDAFNFCKPVAKSERDRQALVRAAVGLGDERLKGRIFFGKFWTGTSSFFWIKEKPFGSKILTHTCARKTGSDSAPHPLSSKAVPPGKKPAAGCFTQPYATQLVISAVEKALADGLIPGSYMDLIVDNLRKFLGEDGRKFYGLPVADQSKHIVLEKREEEIEKLVGTEGVVQVACFGGGEKTWSLKWD
jgi:dihydroorotase